MVALSVGRSQRQRAGIERLSNQARAETTPAPRKGSHMLHRPRLLGSLAASIFLAACGGGGNNYSWGSLDGGGGGGGDMAGAQNNNPVDMAPAQPVYPPGPYGNALGKTIKDITLQGYRLTRQQTDSTKLQYADISLHDYHANPRCKCLLITVGALWCGACRQEQPQLVQDVSGDSNFCVLGIVQEGQSPGMAATKDDVDAWTQEFMQNFFVAQGTPTTNHYFDPYVQNGMIGLPFNLVVTPADMKIVDSWQGFDPQGHMHAMNSCGM